MKEPNYNNLLKDLCPNCKSKLEISSVCGRRKCNKPGCYFTISRETISRMLGLPVEICFKPLINYKK